MTPEQGNAFQLEALIYGFAAVKSEAAQREAEDAATIAKLTADLEVATAEIASSKNSST